MCKTILGTVVPILLWTQEVQSIIVYAWVNKDAQGVTLVVVMFCCPGQVELPPGQVHFISYRYLSGGHAHFQTYNHAVQVSHSSSASKHSVVLVWRTSPENLYVTPCHNSHCYCQKL